MKLTISLDDALVERIDNYADDNFMTRSGFISLATSQYLNADELKKAVVDMSSSMRRIADKSAVDDEVIQELQNLESLAKFMTGTR